jgi:hypothetical protein
MPHSRSSSKTDLAPLSAATLVADTATPVQAAAPDIWSAASTVPEAADVASAPNENRRLPKIKNFHVKNRDAAGFSALRRAPAGAAETSQSISANALPDAGPALSPVTVPPVAPIAAAALLPSDPTVGLLPSRSTATDLPEVVNLVSLNGFSAPISTSSSGRGKVVGNVPAQATGSQMAETSGALTLGITNQTAVNALAVNTAEAQYLAATGTVLNGAGLKIGILSDSFNLNGGEAAQIANGDLPSLASIHILQEGTSGNDEGQALAELIHSIAPAAQIYFYSGVNGQSQMAAGINALTAAGCNVIVDDITYTNEPFFQDTGTVTQAAEAAVASGVSYFTSAGNSGNNYYQASFSPMTFTLPGIGSETVNNVTSGSPYEAIQLGASATLDMTMEWTQAFGANQYDLGMALYSYSAGSYTLVQDFTTSSLGGNPVLSIYENTSLAAGTYYMAFYESGSNLVNGQAVAPGTFKIIAFPDSSAVIDGVGSQVGSGTSIGHELAPGINSVAAVGVTNTPSEGIPVPIVEPFSSAGIGKTYINAAGATLATPINDKTPDFSATDGSPTSIFNPFYGTSAAVANAGAVGLLVLQADARLTPAQVTDLLEASAIPSDNPTTGGAGLIQASKAVASALLANTTPIWTAQGATTLWGTGANWSDGAAPQGAANVVIADGMGILSGAYAVNLNVPSASMNSLKLDGGTVTGAQPELFISAGDTLTAGSVTIGAATIDVAGTFVDNGALLTGSAAGQINIESTGSVTLAGSVAATNIAFTGSGGDLVFTTRNGAGFGLLNSFFASITNFAAGDIVDIRGLAPGGVNSVSVAGAAVTVLDSSGGMLARLNVSGATSGLRFMADGSGGTELVSSGPVSYQNMDVAGLTGVQTPTIAAGTTGQLLISDVDSNGGVTAGLASVSVIVPFGYNSVLVTAPGVETVQGNGAANVSDVFGGSSSVQFNSLGGNGAVTAQGAGDFIGLTGSTWSIYGANAGNDTVNSSAANLLVSTYGAANVVGLAATAANVVSDGANDLIASFGGNDTISVGASANILVAGGSVTVYATATSTAVNSFFSSMTQGGQIDFINNSATAASVTGSSNNQAAPGSVTVYAGMGGGYYEGGEGGHNSLTGGTIGGSGNSTLVGEGIGNLLSVSQGSNALFAAAGGQSTLSAGAGTFNNVLVGEGNDSIYSAGSGLQAYFIGSTNNETITGSAASGAVNRFFFIQSSGGGTDNIIGFRPGIDDIYVNPTGYTLDAGVSINSFSANYGPGGGTLVQLNDGTEIKLIGVSLSNTQEVGIIAAGGQII